MMTEKTSNTGVHIDFVYERSVRSSIGEHVDMNLIIFIKDVCSLQRQFAKQHNHCVPYETEEHCSFQMRPVTRIFVRLVSWWRRRWKCSTISFTSFVKLMMKNARPQHDCFFTLQVSFLLSYHLQSSHVFKNLASIQLMPLIVNVQDTSLFFLLNFFHAWLFLFHKRDGKSLWFLLTFADIRNNFYFPQNLYLPVLL